jgi:hypothetical protein
MAKKGSKTEVKGSTDTVTENDAPQTDGTSEKPAPAPRTRGPRGVPESAVITVLATGNPKRAGSKAHAAFAQYRSGMTVKEFADAVGKEATGHLVYDTAHKYISIEGYTPGKMFEPKPPKEKKEKAPKVKGSDATAGNAEAEAEAQAETIA